MQCLRPELCGVTDLPLTTETISDSFTCTENGDFPNPEECSTYYSCVHGVAHLRACPGDTLFNPNTLYCDWPANVPIYCSERANKGAIHFTFLP